MELRILNSIIYGSMKPWTASNVDDKYYRPLLTREFTNPSNPNDFYALIQSILTDKPELFAEESISVYLAQPDGHYRPSISEPLIKTSTGPPKTPTQKFYHFLIRNEVTRLTATIVTAICKKIENIDRKEIINDALISAKTLLQNTTTVRTGQPTDELSNYVLDELKLGVIRFIKELELLFPHFLKYPPSDNYELFGKDAPPENWPETTSEYNRIHNRLSDYFGQPTKIPKSIQEGLTFGFKRK